MKNLFCAKCQAVTEHSGKVDMNGEFVFSCTNAGCDRFIKFPADTDVTKFNELALKHKEANGGQVSLEQQETVLSEILDAPEPVEAAPVETPTEEAPAA